MTPLDRLPGVLLFLAVTFAGLWLVIKACDVSTDAGRRRAPRDRAHERLAYYLDPQHHHPPTREDNTR